MGDTGGSGGGNGGREGGTGSKGRVVVVVGYGLAGASCNFGSGNVRNCLERPCETSATDVDMGLETAGGAPG